MTAPVPPVPPPRGPFEAARLGRHPALRVLAVLAGSLVAVTLVAVTVMGTIALLVRTEESASQVFEGPVERVVVRVHGSVEISPGPEPDRGARVERWSEFSFRRPTVAVTLADGVLDVRVRCQGPAGICGNRLHLTVPAGADVDVRAHDVHVADTTGAVRVGLDTGSVVLERLSGPVDVDLGAGAIRGRELSSDEVRVRNGAGPVQLDLVRAPAVVDAETGAGPITVTLPPGEVYRVDAHTNAGPTRVEVATDPDSPRVVRLRTGAGPVVVRDQ